MFDAGSCPRANISWTLTDMHHEHIQDNVACSSVAVAFASSTIITTVRRLSSRDRKLFRGCITHACGSQLIYLFCALVPRFREYDVPKKALRGHVFYYGFMELAWLAIGIASAVRQFEVFARHRTRSDKRAWHFKL